MSFYSLAVMSFFVFFCHIMKNIHQDDVDDNKVIKKKKLAIQKMSSNKNFLKEMLQIITIGETHLTESLYCCKDLRKKFAPFSYI